MPFKGLPIPNPVKREVTVVVLNQTEEELDVDTESRHLLHGKYDSDEALPPLMILPGQNGLWRCTAQGVGRGVEGSVTYRIAGEVPHDKVRFAWKNSYFGSNHYDTATTKDGVVVNVIGGEGDHAVVVFVVGKAA